MNFNDEKHTFTDTHEAQVGDWFYKMDEGTRRCYVVTKVLKTTKNYIGTTSGRNTWSGFAAQQYSWTNVVEAYENE